MLRLNGLMGKIDRTFRSVHSPKILTPSKSEADVPKFSPLIVILVPGVASLGLIPVTTGAGGFISEIWVFL